MTRPHVATQTRGWTPSDQSFGARLALVRQRMGWGNVKEAAQACEVPVESWRSWERDNRAPRNVVEIAARIADKTGCDYGWLLTGRRLRDMGAQSTVANLARSVRMNDTHPNGGPRTVATIPTMRRPAPVKMDREQPVPVG